MDIKSTTIKFYLPRTESVSLRLYDITGQEVETLVEGEVPGGMHELHWTAQIQAGGFMEAKKLIYQK